MVPAVCCYYFIPWFHDIKCDTSFFIYHNSSYTTYLLLYIYDIILTASSLPLITKVVSVLSYEFPMSDLGPLFSFSVSSSHISSRLFLSQNTFVQDIFARAYMSTSNPYNTPPDKNQIFTLMESRRLTVLSVTNLHVLFNI